MVLFAVVLALCAGYQGVYLWHSARRGRAASAVGAGLAALLCAAAAAALLLYRN